MLALLKALVVLAWLAMLLLLVLAPRMRVGAKAREVIIDAAACGSRLEMEVFRAMKRLAPGEHLTIVDDGASEMRSRVIEKILARNPGLRLQTKTARRAG